jgi:hypothetical protein
MSFLLSLMFSHQQNQRTRGRNRFCQEAGSGWGEVAQTMYTHVSQCKIGKTKEEKNKVSKMRKGKKRSISLSCFIIQNGLCYKIIV